ncbi:MAG: roadblock/LC7 domain-containing protein [candidate division Zixibacteria bacterium]|nr:roadblock/LC7 domain-containing protein [candidate division Zixibacteria bacterium]
MFEILEELNKTQGITGSMIVGSDGIVIAADLHQELQDDTLGAMASSIVSTVRKTLEKMNQVPLRQITVEANQGKLFLTDVEIGTLVVTTAPAVNLGLVRLEIKNAASRLKKR